MQSHQALINYFSLLERQGLLGPSYLFIGDNQPLVENIIKLISCQHDEYFCGECWDCRQIALKQHPDVRVIEPDNFSITIDSIREGINFLSLKSYCLPRKILVIAAAHHFSLPAANAFLKTLEEPPQHSFIGVCSTQLESLLPTIISRCRKIFLPPRTQAAAPEDETLLQLLRQKDLVLNDRKKFTALLWSLVMLLRKKLGAELGVRNNQLPGTGEYEIILSRYGPGELSELLSEAVALLAAAQTANINLSLSLLRAKLR